MTQKKISNYIRFFVLLLPLFVVLLAVFRNGDYTTIYTFFDDLLDPVPIIFSEFKQILVNILGVENGMFHIAFYYLTYVFCIEFTMLIFDFILFIPRWIRGLIFSYEKKNKN